GVLMTHYTRSKVDLGLLGDVTLAAGGSAALAEEVSAANTGRHAYEIWQREGLLRPAGDGLCLRVRSVLLRAGQGRLDADLAMVGGGGGVGGFRGLWGGGGTGAGGGAGGLTPVGGRAGRPLRRGPGGAPGPAPWGAGARRHLAAVSALAPELTPPAAAPAVPA